MSEARPPKKTRPATTAAKARSGDDINKQRQQTQATLLPCVRSYCCCLLLCSAAEAPASRVSERPAWAPTAKKKAPPATTAKITHTHTNSKTKSHTYTHTLPHQQQQSTKSNKKFLPPEAPNPEAMHRETLSWKF